jgi:phosphonate transport system substrate-binding protein
MTDQTLIFETFLAPAWYKTCLYITEYIERYVQIPTFLLHGEMLEDFAEAHADAGFLGTFSYIQLLNHSSCPVELIASAVSQETSSLDQPPTFFNVVVRKESLLTSLNDLSGCTWAYHVGTPHIEDHFLYQHGIPAIDFKERLETTSQAQSLRLLLEGRVEATAIDTRMLALALHNSPRMAAQLRVLGTYSTAPGPLVVVASHLPALLKQQIQEALLTMHLHPFYAQQLQQGSIEHFIPITNIHYSSSHVINTAFVDEGGEPEFSLSAHIL